MFTIDFRLCLNCEPSLPGHFAPWPCGPRRSVMLSWSSLVRHRLHATADEIFAALNRDDPRASRATVYNSLRSLAHSGLVREVISDGKAARYDANVRRHHHFVCERCGGVEDIEWFDFPRTAGRPALGGRSVRTFRNALSRHLRELRAYKSEYRSAIMKLAERHCVPCRGGVPPLKGEALERSRPCFPAGR